MTVRDNFQFVYHGPSSTNGHKAYVNWKVEGNYMSGAWSVEDLEWLQEQAQVQIDNLRIKQVVELGVEKTFSLDSRGSEVELAGEVYPIGPKSTLFLAKAIEEFYASDLSELCWGVSGLRQDVLDFEKKVEERGCESKAIKTMLNQTKNGLYPYFVHSMDFEEDGEVLYVHFTSENKVDVNRNGFNLFRAEHPDAVFISNLILNHPAYKGANDGDK